MTQLQKNGVIGKFDWLGGCNGEVTDNKTFKELGGPRSVRPTEFGLGYPEPEDLVPW